MSQDVDKIEHASLSGSELHTNEREYAGDPNGNLQGIKGQWCRNSNNGDIYRNVDGAVGTETTNWELIIQSASGGTYTSTSDPTATEDTDSGYKIGDHWVNTSSDKVFVCVDSSSGSAIWLRVDNKKFNTATSAPSSTDDDSAGYEAGSIWIDTSTDFAYMCVDAATGSAIWVRVDASSSASVTASTSDPASSDDTDAGYEVGDIHINTASNTAFVLVDSASGSAIWQEIGSGGSGGIATAFYEEGHHESTNGIGRPSRLASETNYGFGSWYDDQYNRTYITYQEVDSSLGGTTQTWLFYIDHFTNEVSDHYPMGDPVGGSDNYHTRACITVADDGYIIVAHSQYHNDPIEVKRVNPDDLSDVTKVDDIGTDNAYPHLWRRSNGDLHMSVRSSHNNIRIYKSTDDGQTWSLQNGGPMVTLDPTDMWAYHNMIHQSINDDMWMVINPRDHSATYLNFPYIYLIKSSDGVTWTNVDGSFSKDVSVNGAITSTELQNNCVVDENTISNYKVFKPYSGCVTDDGTPILLSTNGIAETDGDTIDIGSASDGVYLYIWNGTSWDKKPFTGTIPDTWSQSNKYVNGNAWDVLSNDGKYIDVIVSTNKGRHTNVTPVRWRSEDGGDTWHEIETLAERSQHDVNAFASVGNFPDSPYYTTYGAYNVDANYSDLFIRTYRSLWEPLFSAQTSSFGVDGQFFDDFADNKYSSRDLFDSTPYDITPISSPFIILSRPEWESVANSQNVTGSEIHLPGSPDPDHFLRTEKYVRLPVDVRYSFRLTGTTGGKAHDLTFMGQSSAYSTRALDNCYGIQVNGGGAFKWRYFENGVKTEIINQSWSPDTAQHTVRLTIDENGNGELFMDGTSVGTGQDTRYTEGFWVGLGLVNDPGYDLYIDWIDIG